MSSVSMHSQCGRGRISRLGIDRARHVRFINFVTDVTPKLLPLSSVPDVGDNDNVSQDQMQYGGAKLIVDAL